MYFPVRTSLWSGTGPWATQHDPQICIVLLMVLSPIGGFGQIITDAETYSTVQLLLVINYRSLWNALARLIGAVFVVLKRGG
jgi:hypothetical protein